MVHRLCLITLLGVSVMAHAAGDAFVRVSAADPRYLETSDGKPFIPVGLNLVSPPYVPKGTVVQQLQEQERWLAKLATNGGNHIRIWLSASAYELETTKAGEYDFEKLRNIQSALACAREHGIYVKMTIEHFREVDPAQKAQTWAIKALHHTSKGGTAGSMKEWVASPEARKQYIRKLEFLGEHFRDEPAVYGWELWNEMNAIRSGDYLEWTAFMLPELHRIFPKHLGMQSLGSFDRPEHRERYQKFASLSGNDIAQVHRYLDQGAKLDICKGPMDVLAADAVRVLLAGNPSKPVMLAESGAVEPSHSGPSKLYAKDKQGTLLHDVLFAPFFSGAAGTGQCWHWDHYVNKNDLWWHFGRFAQAVKGIDPRQEKFEPMMIEHPRLRVYLLKGTKTLLAWCRDARYDWKQELVEDKSPEKLAGLSINLSEQVKGFDAAKVDVYQPWADRWSEGALREGKTVLPEFERSIVLKIRR